MSLELTGVKEWGIKNERPIMIAGPCSVETEEQVMQTAIRLKDSNLDVLRGGIWKPRTRPNTFEGVGSIGLNWLKDAGRAIGVPVTTEVANSKHVYEALRAQIDILWIGARTTVNPFAVQEIADAVRGIDIPVLVKNPINPDLSLWMGALERLNKAGITKLGAIHRGFSTHGKSKWRNKPHWEIPIELKRQIPDLPIIVDPSHITGKRELIHPVSQKALDLDFNGLMIESHITPDKALSDAAQQITPERLIEIKIALLLRDSTTSNEAFLDQLEELRDSIDSVDDRIINILAERMQIARQIGECKKTNNITILQKSRWDEIFTKRKDSGVKVGLTEDFMKDLYMSIHKESIRQQETVMNDEEE